MRQRVGAGVFFVSLGLAIYHARSPGDEAYALLALAGVIGGIVLFAGRDLKELHQARPRWQRGLLWLLYLVVGLPVLFAVLVVTGMIGP